MTTTDPRFQTRTLRIVRAQPHDEVVETIEIPIGAKLTIDATARAGDGDWIGNRTYSTTLDDVRELTIPELPAEEPAAA